MRIGLRAKALIIAAGISFLGAVLVFSPPTGSSPGAAGRGHQSRSVAIAQSLSLQLDRIQALGVEVHPTGFEKQCRTHGGSPTEGINFAMVVDRGGTIFPTATRRTMASGSVTRRCFEAVGAPTGAACALASGALLWRCQPGAWRRRQVVGAIVVGIAPDAIPAAMEDSL